MRVTKIKNKKDRNELPKILKKYYYWLYLFLEEIGLKALPKYQP